MRLTTETIAENQKVLIVSKIKHPLINLLKQELIKYNLDVYFSPSTKTQVNKFDYCFLINEHAPYEKPPQAKTKLIFIFINQPVFQTAKQHRYKTVSIKGDIVKKEDLTKILWFALSPSNENFLALNFPKIKVPTIKTTERARFFWQLSKKKAFIFILFLFFAAHILFILPLGITTFFYYQSIASLKSDNGVLAQNYLNVARPSLTITKKWYSFIRPTYLLFSLAIIPDNIIDIDGSIDGVTNDGISAENNLKQLSKLLFQKDKNDNDIKTVKLILTNLQSRLADLSDNLTIINQKIPAGLGFMKGYKNQLSQILDLIDHAKKILPYASSLLAEGTSKKYLILFANNMELRPGGGFIGSFGILNVTNLTINNLQVYDVYDADGQLKAHVDPPEAIGKYLGQPHFFLRDVAFYPDFLDTYLQAKFFLNSEMNMHDFSGAVLVTTSAVQNLLRAYGEIYLPDFHEKVNADNFYLKAEIYSQDNFFPGSIRKKNFLGALTRTIFLNLPETSQKAILGAIKKSLDEKQIVVYLDDSRIQPILDSSFWSGRLIQTSCPSASINCLDDFLFPLEANVGVNKANFFVTRSYDLKTSFGSQGEISHVFTLDIKNDSPDNVFPGGIYRNYFQILLPQDTIVDKITKNGVLVENVDDKNDVLKTVGFLIEIQPRSGAQLKIKYHLNKTLSLGKSLYQLVLEKQIGQLNSDFNLHFTLDNNFKLLNQNFTPLVKDGDLNYNTSFASDKIFFLELNK